MKPTGKFLSAVTLAIAAAGLGMLAATYLPGHQAGTTIDPASLSATVLSQPRPLPAFMLHDQMGEPFDRTSLEGRWSFLFFGFTHCPDICPTTLAMLAEVQRSAGDLPAADRPAVVLVTVDPARDTPARLAEYVAWFRADVSGVTGDDAAIAVLTEQLGVAHARVEDGNGGYTVDHTGAVFLIDRQARLAAIFTSPLRLDYLQSDFRSIVAMADPR